MLALAGCAAPVPTLAWAYNPDAYYGDRDWGASLFTRDVAFVVKAPSISMSAPAVVALDTKTGAELWHRDDAGWLVQSPTGELWFSSRPYWRMERLDARTGQVFDVIEFPQRFSDDAQLYGSSTGLLVGDGASLTAIDWKTGARRWRTPLSAGRYWKPTIAGARVAIPGQTHHVLLALETGATLADIQAAGGCCGAVVSPNGEHVFFDGEDHSTVSVDGQGRVTHFPGQVRAASNTHWVVEQDKVLRAYAYGRAEPAVTLGPNDADDYFGAVTLAGSNLFYFHKADGGLWQNDLAKKRRRLVRSIPGFFAITTCHGAVSSGPHLGVPPVVAGERLFLQEHSSVVAMSLPPMR